MHKLHKFKTALGLHDAYDPKLTENENMVSDCWTQLYVFFLLG